MNSKLALLLALALCIGIAPIQATELAISSPAPNFGLPNVDGKTVSLADFNDCKGMTIIFSNNTCPFAKDYQNRLKKLYSDYHPRGIVFVVINSNGVNQTGDSFEAMQKLASSEKLPFPYLSDANQEIAKIYGVTHVPQVFIFNTQHNLVYRGRIDDNTEEAKVKKHEVREVLELLLSGKPIAPEASTTKPFGCALKIKQ